MQQCLSPSRHLARNFMEFQKRKNTTKSNRSEKKKNQLLMTWIKVKILHKWISSEIAKRKRTDVLCTRVRHRLLVIDDNFICKSCLMPSLSIHNSVAGTTANWPLRVTIAQPFHYYVFSSLFFSISTDRIANGFCLAIDLLSTMDVRRVQDLNKNLNWKACWYKSMCFDHFGQHNQFKLNVWMNWSR